MKKEPQPLLITEEQTTYYVYLLRCRDGTLYCGYTTDLQKRLHVHNSGMGAKYTRSRLPVELVYFETFSTKSEALKREWAIKKLTRAQKQQLIEKSRATEKNRPAH